MLDAGRAPAFRRGLTMFFDHADPGVVYVAPDVPRLVADPEPQLSLFVFRGDVGNGALLQLQVELAPSPEQLAAARRELAEAGQFGNDGAPVLLARPSWRAGSVKLYGFLEDRALRPRVLAVGEPSLLGDPNVVIAARLDADAAALAEASLRGNALPTSIAFELETLGLAGPLGIAIEADLQAIHDRLSIGGALTTPYGAAKIKATWEELAKENLIRIEVLDESGELETNRAEAMRRVGEQLVMEMLTSELPAEAPPQLDDRPVAPIELSFRLTMRREELATSKRWSFHERRAVPVRYAAAASLIDLLGERDPTAFIRELDLATRRRSVLVRAEPELAALGLAALEVDVRVGERDETLRSVVLTDQAPGVELELERDGFTPLAFRTRARFDPTLTRATDRSTEWERVDGSVVSVSARRLFPPRTSTFAIGRAELDWLEGVEVSVSAPPEPMRRLVLDAGHRTAELSLPGAGDAPVGYTVTWRGKPDEPSATDPPRDASDEVMVLDAPFGDSMHVLCVPLPRELATLTVELRSEHEDFVHTRTLAWDGDDRTPRTADLRRLAAGPRSYRWREVAVALDGSVRTGDWIRSDDPTLVLGGEGFVVASCDVHAFGGPSGRGSVAIALTLRTGEYASSALLEAEAEHARLVLAHPGATPAPTLLVEEFMPDGSVRRQTVDPIEPIIVLRPLANDPV